MIPPSACPILDDQSRILSLSSDLIRSFRRYKRSLDACRDCPADNDCPVQSQVEAVIHQSISEVRDEWDRTHTQAGPR